MKGRREGEGGEGGWVGVVNLKTFQFAGSKIGFSVVSGFLLFSSFLLFLATFLGNSCRRRSPLIARMLGS